MTQHTVSTGVLYQTFKLSQVLWFYSMREYENGADSRLNHSQLFWIRKFVKIIERQDRSLILAFSYWWTLLAIEFPNISGKNSFYRMAGMQSCSTAFAE